jgi:hypothetical protein
LQGLPFWLLARLIGTSVTREPKTKRQSRSSAVVGFYAKRREQYEVLFGGHFFLFAFHAHLLEFALFSVVGFLYLGLDLGCRFFELG